MFMSSSLVSGPVNLGGLDWSREVTKTKSFLSLFSKVEELDTNTLYEMVSKFADVDAIFALFPKAQIGGPREILIQAVKLRIMVKFLEVLSEKLCKLHPKEMLTKDNMKAQTQSDAMSSFKQEMGDLKKQNIPSMAVSFNMDASKWAPGFVMEHFFSFVMAFPIPDEMKHVLLNVISAFSCKFMLTPDSLVNKWKKKPVDEPEDREDLEWYRKKSMEQANLVEILSGMGQGMLHKLSSFYACVMDDSADKIVQSIVQRVTKVRVNSKTILSSDDKTKFILFSGMQTLDRIDSAMKLYTRCWDSITRLQNIHINWKKSGMNFIIAEFNSLFSIGKRMVWATIKDIYNANSIPDLSNPEDAVQFMLGSIRRCLEHGVYMTTISHLMRMARAQLMRYYKIDQKMVEMLMEKLDCNEERLPYHLGFLPCSNPFSVLIMGKEVTMFCKENSDKLELFYKKLYSAQTNKMDQKMKNLVPFQEDSRGRFWMEVNMRMDKSLKEMKMDFFKNKLKMEMGEILDRMNNQTLNMNLGMNDMKSFREFSLEYFVGMRRNYEINELMPIHSLVRALQYSASKATMMPKSKVVLESEEEMLELRNKISMMGNSFQEEKDMMRNRIKALNMFVKSTRMDMIEFVDQIFLRGDENNSMIGMYDSLRMVEDQEIEFRNTLKTFPKTDKFFHGTMRKIRFYISPVGMSVKPKEVLQHIFENTFASSNRLVSTVSGLFNMRNYDKEKNGMLHVYENPFRAI
jgi:hypothetical protein